MGITNNSNTYRQVIIKFILLCLLLIGYVVYLGYKYDFATGGVAALLTWSFFVLCTPIADAGFLLDFPLRLLFNIRMVTAEIVVWLLAILINVIVVINFVEFYNTTVITKLLYNIITNPYPYWAVILLSAAGTFLSIRFGDELMDVIHHHDRRFLHSHHFKHELILIVFFGVVFVLYYQLIASLNIEIKI